MRKRKRKRGKPTCLHSSVWPELPAFTRRVEGSNPSGGTKFFLDTYASSLYITGIALCRVTVIDSEAVPPSPIKVAAERSCRTNCDYGRTGI